MMEFFKLGVAADGVSCKAWPQFFLLFSKPFGIVGPVPLILSVLQRGEKVFSLCVQFGFSASP